MKALPSTLLEGIIVKGVGGAYTVAAPQGRIVCVARGLFRKQNLTPLVGDRVRFRITHEADREGVLLEILPRQNELLRPRAANMDQVIVTMAVTQPAFDAVMLDRYLVLTEDAGIPAVVCITKADLSPDEAEAALPPYIGAGYPALAVSAHSRQGIEALKALMTGKVSALAGPSGVGKSSLLNALYGHAARETGTLSPKLQRGKHTTRHTELLPLSEDGMAGYCLDTPGFSRLSLDAIPVRRYESLFPEFAPYLGACYFSDCRHLGESGCAVIQQIGLAVHPARYNSYRMLMEGSP